VKCCSNNVNLKLSGYYLNTTANRCAHCERGTYQPEAQQTTCIACPADTSTNSVASVSFIVNMSQVCPYTLSLKPSFDHDESSFTKKNHLRLDFCAFESKSDISSSLEDSFPNISRNSLEFGNPIPFPISVSTRLELIIREL